MISFAAILPAGFADSHTGQDVRKGALGRYAVRDFQIDPQLITPLECVDWHALSKEGLSYPDGMEADTVTDRWLLCRSARAELYRPWDALSCGR